MKSAFRIILALSLPLAACGHSGPELFLDRTTTALECSSTSDPDCTAGEVSRHHSGQYADAGAPRPEMDECYGDGDCEYGEVCERRHGVSLCQTPDGKQGHDESYGDAGCADDPAGHASDGAAPDAGGAACDPAAYGDDARQGADACIRNEDNPYEDRSGSNSGRH